MNIGMNKLCALLLCLGLSVHVFAQSADGGTTRSVAEADQELIEINQEDLERVLRELALTLGKQSATQGTAQTNPLRQQLLLSLLASRGQAATVQGGNHTHYVAPQSASRAHDTESYEARLERIETMLLLLLNQRAEGATSTGKTIIRRNSKGAPLDTQIQLLGSSSSADRERIAHLEEQLSRLLQEKRAHHQVDTIYRVDTVRIYPMETLRAPQPLEIQPKTSVVMPLPITADTVRVVEHRVDTVSVVDVADFKRSVYFAIGKYKLDTSASKTLQEVVAFLKQHPQAKIRVVGFASSDGSAQRNALLAQRRMQVAVASLREAGVTNQIVTETGGIDRQTSNYHLARRVDILLAN